MARAGKVHDDFQIACLAAWVLSFSSLCRYVLDGALDNHERVKRLLELSASL